MFSFENQRGRPAAEQKVQANMGKSYFDCAQSLRLDGDVLSCDRLEGPSEADGQQGPGNLLKNAIRFEYRPNR
jgi:hypothetical protein